MNKPSKSKAEPTDGETLRALQFALAPLDRAMRDADVESWPRQLMHRTVFPSILQSAEDERRERNLDLECESRVDYASWEYDEPLKWRAHEGFVTKKIQRQIHAGTV